ncbi:MAG: hypothetical protein O3C05_03290, partial [Proteobacteria bacterium]|nr:hypothetical protein [Pseudomonadota bacterium]
TDRINLIIESSNKNIIKALKNEKLYQYICNQTLSDFIIIKECETNTDLIIDINKINTNKS